MALELVGTVRIDVNAAGGSLIVFDNIPQDGKDLLVFGSLKSTSSGVASVRVIHNNQSSNFDYGRLFSGTRTSDGYTSGAMSHTVFQNVADAPLAGLVPGLGESNYWGTLRGVLPNYAGSGNQWKVSMFHCGQATNYSSPRAEHSFMSSFNPCTVTDASVPEGGTSSPTTKLTFKMINGYAQDSVISLYKTT